MRKNKDVLEKAHKELEKHLNELPEQVCLFPSSLFLSHPLLLSPLLIPLLPDAFLLCCALCPAP